MDIYECLKMVKHFLMLIKVLSRKVHWENSYLVNSILLSNSRHMSFLNLQTFKLIFKLNWAVLFSLDFGKYFQPEIKSKFYMSLCFWRIYKNKPLLLSRIQKSSAFFTKIFDNFATKKLTGSEYIWIIACTYYIKIIMLYFFQYPTVHKQII